MTDLQRKAHGAEDMDIENLPPQTNLYGTFKTTENLEANQSVLSQGSESHSTSQNFQDRVLGEQDQNRSSHSLKNFNRQKTLSKKLLNKADQSQNPQSLAVALDIIIRDFKPDYDSNFQTIFASKDCNIQTDNQAIIKAIIEKKRGEEFVTLFKALRPYLFDLCKRKEGFEEVVDCLRRISEKEKIFCRSILKKLEVKDLIIFLLESCHSKSMAKIGPWLVNQFYPLPIFYPINNTSFKPNFDCCSELLFQVNKPLVLNLGSRTSHQKGKSSVLAYIFFTQNPIGFSSNSSFTHNGSVDFYSKTPLIEDKYLIADVHGYSANSSFVRMSRILHKFSGVTILHVTEADFDIDEQSSCYFIKDDELVDLVVCSTNKPFLILFRDYDEDIHENLIGNIQDLFTTKSNYLGLYPIPKLDGRLSSSETNDIKEETRQIILDTLSELNFGGALFSMEKAKECYAASVEAGKEVAEDTLSHRKTQQEIDSELILDRISSLVSENQNICFYERLFPFFWIDYLSIEEEKKLNKLNHAKPNDANKAQTENIDKQYEEIHRNITNLQKNRKEVVFTPLIRALTKILVSNQPARIYALTEMINKWKEPILQPTKHAYLQLCSQRMNLPGDVQAKALEDIRRLEDEISDKEIALDTFIDEIQCSFEVDQTDILDYSGVKRYIKSVLDQGAPVNLINGKTLKYGHALLREVFDELGEDHGKVFVISIIGAQSSAKSTLLNYLFGCGFATSAGRCTKGLYMSLLKHINGWFIVIIDTEGLLSVVARDQVFDNQIATMAFSCSHIIIINNKGEINSKLKDLLEICVYALKHLNLSHVQPKIMFALRDMADNNKETQQELLMNMKISIEEAARNLTIDVNSIIGLSEDDVFLFPPAFQRTKAQNRSEIHMNNPLFSKTVLDMRNKIFGYLNSTFSEKSLANLADFYVQTEELWNNINRHGQEIMKSRNLLEIDLKETATQKTLEIYNVNNEVFVNSIRQLINNLRAQQLLQDYDSNKATSSFHQLLTEEHDHVRDSALSELEEEIFNKEKYGIISTYYTNFTDIIEYNLGWQRQNFLGEWRSIEINWQAESEKEQSKRQLKCEVDKILGMGNNLRSHEKQIFKLFELRKEKLLKEYNERIQTFSLEKVGNLILKIHNHYKCALRKIKRQTTISVPTYCEIRERIEKKQRLHDPEGWAKATGIVSWLWDTKPSRQAMDRISRQFEKFTEMILPILNDISTEEAAVGVVGAALSSIDDMLMQKLPVNQPTFLQSCILEAISMQYQKSRHAEEILMKKQMHDLEQSQDREEEHLRKMIHDSKNTYNQGINTAQKCFKDILDKFCLNRGSIIQNEVMEMIEKEFPNPESANIKAYGNSFRLGNYVNVVKYVVNVNQFIKEIYTQKIDMIKSQAIDRVLQTTIEEFRDIITQVWNLIQQWGQQNISSSEVKISSLSILAKENSQLELYFPDLYNIEISEIVAFSKGFEKKIADSLSQQNYGMILKTLLTQGLDAFLENQYSHITGCQARCPICRNKCIRGAGPHADHKTDCHLLGAFAGFRTIDTQKATLRHCFDPINYNSEWIIEEKTFKNLDDLINSKYPKWRAEFPTKDQVDKHRSIISPEIIEGWVATRDVLMNHFIYIDDTSDAWLEQVEISKRLDPAVSVEGYYRYNPNLSLVD